MRGAFGVGKKPPAPAPPPPPLDSNVVSLARIGTFEASRARNRPAGDTRRLFVVEQRGTVRVVREGEVLPAPFLDIRERIKPQSEGLLSIAFAPDYAASGLFYAFYNSTAGKGDIRISEFRRHSANPDRTAEGSERVLLTIAKPWDNHNGGMLQFGPDGHLYASVGDGDSGVLNPPGFFAQRRDDLLGNILRIDPRSGKPYKIPRDNPFVGLDGVRARSGPTACATPGASGSTIRRARCSSATPEHAAGGSEPCEHDAGGAQLRLAVLRRIAALRQDSVVSECGSSTARIPGCERRLRGHRRHRRPRPAASRRCPAATSTATSVPEGSRPWL